MRFVSAAAHGLRRAAAAVLRALPPMLRDLVGVAGAASIVYGIWQMHVPAAWIAGGAMAVLAALRLSGASHEKSE